MTKTKLLALGVLAFLTLSVAPVSAHAIVPRFGLNAGINYSPIVPSPLSSRIGFVGGANLELGFVPVFAYQVFAEFERANFNLASSNGIGLTNLLKFYLGRVLYLGAGAQVRFSTDTGGGTNVNLALSTGVNLSHRFFVDVRAVTDFDSLFDLMVMSAQLGFRF